MQTDTSTGPALINSACLPYQMRVRAKLICTITITTEVDQVGRLLDTSIGYALAEEIIGRTTSTHSQGIVLSRGSVQSD